MRVGRRPWGAWGGGAGDGGCGALLTGVTGWVGGLACDAPELGCSPRFVAPSFKCSCHVGAPTEGTCSSSGLRVQSLCGPRSGVNWQMGVVLSFYAVEDMDGGPTAGAHPRLVTHIFVSVTSHFKSD